MRKYFFFIVFPALLFAQYQPDSLFFLSVKKLPNKVASSFDKQNNTSYFLSSINYQNRLDNLQYYLFDNYSASAIHSSEKSLSETHKFRFGIDYSAIDNLSFGLLQDYLNFKDSRRSAINSSNRASSEIFSKYFFTDSVYLAVMGGITSNTQVDITDKGNILEAEGGFRKMQMLDLIFSSEFKMRNESIKPRTNKQNKVSLLIETVDNSLLSNSLSTYYELQRNDFYLQADTVTAAEFGITKNIQQRTEQSYGIENKLLNLSITPEINSTLSASYFNHQVDRNYYYYPDKNPAPAAVPSRINEFKLETQAELLYLTKSTDSRFKIIFQERDEKRTIPNKKNLGDILYDDLLNKEMMMNNSSKRISLSWSSQLVLSEKDIVNIVASHTKLQYDTPSEMNKDDRDELLSIARVQYSRKLLPWFSVSAILEGTTSKLVYIASARSSNNNSNKILRLQSSSNLQSKYFSNVATYDLMSNYTIYDYEDLTSGVKSFSFRQLLLSDSLSVPLKPSVRFKFTLYLKYSEQASMDWKSFTVAPLRDNNERFYHVQLFNNWGFSEVAIGLRYFSILTSTFKGAVKSEEMSYRSVGPSTEVSLFLKDYFVFRFSGWLEFISRRNENPYSQSSFQTTVSYKF